MQVGVYGASGHTGRFVVAELQRRAHTPIAIGRDAERLAACARSGVAVRVAALDDPAALVAALDGTQAVINCAGPVLDTAEPLITAALTAGAHYLDVTAEQASAQSSLGFGAAARERGIVILPAVGFYGGLADLLVTAALGGRTSADRIEIAVALDR